MPSDPAQASPSMQLALGPLLYYWPRETVFEFYQQIAETPVDLVYLGEAVCSRRHELRLADWIDVARMLRDAGKQAILSTQVLIESGSDAAVARRIVENGEFLVEANDMGAVQMVAGKLPFVAGPHLNLYNQPALQWMADLGAVRWVPPLEMAQTELQVLQQQRPHGLQTDVFALGRMPLAFSARCFTARHRNLPKDDCQFSCIDYPDGLLLQTREGEGFLTLNGIQTQSAHVCNLVQELPTLQAMGVEVLRLSPQSLHMRELVQLWRDALDQRLTPADAHAQMLPLLPDQPCNGYWHGRSGMEQIAVPA